jgi:hypothetical protein
VRCDFADRVDDRSPNLDRIVLDPTRLGIVLAKFAVRTRGDATGRIEQGRGRARGALVDRENGNRAPPPVVTKRKGG